MAQANRKRTTSRRVKRSAEIIAFQKELGRDSLEPPVTIDPVYAITGKLRMAYAANLVALHNATAIEEAYAGRKDKEAERAMKAAREEGSWDDVEAGWQELLTERSNAVTMDGVRHVLAFVKEIDVDGEQLPDGYAEDGNDILRRTGNTYLDVIRWTLFHLNRIDLEQYETDPLLDEWYRLMVDAKPKDDAESLRMANQADPIGEAILARRAKNLRDFASQVVVASAANDTALSERFYKDQVEWFAHIGSHNHGKRRRARDETEEAARQAEWEAQRRNAA